jgi:hypothetical protein
MSSSLSPHLFQFHKKMSYMGCKPRYISFQVKGGYKIRWPIFGGCNIIKNACFNTKMLSVDQAHTSLGDTTKNNTPQIF